MPAVGPRKTYELEIPVPNGFGDRAEFHKIDTELRASVGGIERFEISLGYGINDWLIIKGTARCLRDTLTWLRVNRHILPVTMGKGIAELQELVNREPEE